MNAKKYLNSQFGIIQERIKRAYLTNKPVAFIVTCEEALIKRLITNASILPNLGGREIPCEGDNVSIEIGPSVSYELGKMDLKELPALKSPKLFVEFLDNESGMKTAERKEQFAKIAAFIRNYNELSSPQLVSDNTLSRVSYLKDSMIWVFSSEVPTLPPEIELYSEVIKIPIMKKKEAMEYISKIVCELDGIPTAQGTDGYALIDDKEYLEKMYRSLRGLSKTKIHQILLKNKILNGQIYYPDSEDKYLNSILKDIRRESEQLISNSDILQLIPSGDEEPAGLDGLSDWLSDHKDNVLNPDFYKSAFRLNAPKGILVSGVPGTGKSMMAKFIAKAFDDMTLIKLDLGDVMGGFVGDSEKNMNKALELIEAMSPCILWVDEMEKAFAGSSGANGHEVTKRLFGKFLTWMQEKESRGVSCFVFATANDISSMPPELFRSGRFDEKFYTFMPSAKECGEIFIKNISSQNKKYSSNQDSMSLPLFDLGEIKDTTLIDILQSKICIEKDPSRLDVSVNRNNKFLTGSDVAALIIKAKEEYIKRYSKEIEQRSHRTAIFETEEFVKCLELALGKMKTYGETNLEDIARCFADLASNNFASASKQKIVPFEGYDEMRCLSNSNQENGKSGKLYELTDKKETDLFEELKNRYDRSLYLMTRNTLNMLSEDIIKSRRQKK